MEQNTIEKLYETADLIRKMCIECIANFGVGHIGGSSSIIELLTVLYFHSTNIDPEDPKNPNRDRIVLSKGHAAPGLYATLAARGYFDKSLLLTLFTSFVLYIFCHYMHLYDLSFCQAGLPGSCAYALRSR